MQGGYLDAVFRTLARDKALPKYQFERRVDALLAPFMEELLSRRVGGPVTAVVAEFPLKRPADYQSTNVDHVFLCTTRDMDDPWIFLELKTDARSISKHQLERYAEAVSRGMRALLADLSAIGERSRLHGKYRSAIERFADLDSVGDGIRLVVLSPAPLPEPSIAPVDVWLFSELIDVALASYSEEWELFKQRLLPLLR